MPDDTNENRLAEISWMLLNVTASLHQAIAPTGMDFIVRDQIERIDKKLNELVPGIALWCSPERPRYEAPPAVLVGLPVAPEGDPALAARERFLIDLVTQARKAYGPDVWEVNLVLEQATASLRRITGASIKC